VNAQISKGASVAIFGAGPVGLMAALSARFLVAEKIFMVDHHQYRLDFARDTYGAIPINFDKDEDPAEIILKATLDHGVDACIDAVGARPRAAPWKPRSRT
jgi:threonine dehydrogenase-like Zn-dependent dehydrogenase